MYMTVLTKGLMAVNLNPSEDGVFLGPPLRWEYDTYKNLKATRLTSAIIDQNLRGVGGRGGGREREREAVRWLFYQSTHIKTSLLYTDIVNVDIHCGTHTQHLSLDGT